MLPHCNMALGTLMTVITVGLPAIYVSLLIYLVSSIKLKRVSHHSIVVLRIVGYVRFWNICEIFPLGGLVSMMKIADLAHIEIGESFWACAFFNFSFSPRSCLLIHMAHRLAMSLLLGSWFLLHRLYHFHSQSLSTDWRIRRLVHSLS